MKKFPLIIVFATILILGGGIFLISKSYTSPSLPAAYEYFWKEGCPHCANVQSFWDSWEKKDKIKITKIEVGTNQKNNQLLSQRATYCQIPAQEVGVPFLFTPEGKCYLGDQPIIDFLKSI